jgi:ABC-2 type transport system permease protein
MSRISHMMRKEFQQLRRDRRMLRIVLLAPILQLLILGYAADLDVRKIPSVICDLDRTRASRELVGSFLHSGYFTEAARVDSIERIDRYLEHGRAAVALVVPRGYADRLESGGTGELQLIADGSESNVAIAALNYAAVITGRQSEAVLRERLARAGLPARQAQVQARPRVWYNPELKSRNFMVPGILAQLLLLLTMLLSSLAIVKEKESGTLEQLIVTPLKPFELMLGKLLPFALVGFIDIVLVLVAALLLFGIRVQGSLLLLFGLSGVFLLTTLGLGLLVSTVSRNQQQAMMTAVFFVMLPMIMLSGFVFPIENMPLPIQLLTYLMPLRYYFVIIRGLFLKGAGLAQLWDESLILAAFGAGILGLAALRFRKRLE